jgi:hypothetical protein
MDQVLLKNKNYSTLVALTEEEHYKGLMGKAWEPPIMSFLFPKLGVHKFWMKNTISPLDVIFCKNGSIISIEYGEPMSLDLFGPDKEVDLIVEVPAGMSKINNINIGDNVKLILSKDTEFKRKIVFGV